MNQQLKHDQINQQELLTTAVQAAAQFLDGLDSRKAAVLPDVHSPLTQLPEIGLGAEAAVRQFQTQYEAGLSGSAGPRYLGFVTGGSTPAALVGDWLASTYDQNPAADEDSIAPLVEQEAIAWLRQLFGLPDGFAGTFVSGATISNFVGLAQARQWIGQQQGINVAEEGVWGLRPFPILSGTPHARWRGMTQSGRCSIMARRRRWPAAGTKRVSSMAASARPRREAASPAASISLSMAMNHCGVLRKITGAFDRQLWGY